MSGDPDSTEQCFVDSNIWLYAFIESPETASKSAQARILVAQPRVISSQVVNEVCVNLLRKGQRSEDEIRRFVRASYTQHRVVPISKATLLVSSQLRESYSFSYWDSLIVATALEADATLLYSEDMHHDLWIDQRLRIVNPFLSLNSH